MCRVCGVYMLTLLEPDAYARPLQRVCSSRVTLKYVTLTNPNPIMFAHPPRPRIELHTCGYAHVPSVWSVHANPTRAGRVCTPFAARLQLTRNPKIRNPNPNPAVRTESAEYGHAFSYSSRFQTRTACILVLCIVHHRTLVGSGHQTHAGRSIGSDVGRVRTPSISTVSGL